MKKIISILALLWILFSIFWNNVYAINLQSSNVITKKFLEFQWGKTYKINFKNITPRNYNVVQKKFEWINSFPKKLILPEWYSMNIKKNWVDSIFDTTNILNTKINTLKARHIDLWNITISKPILKIYPWKVTYEKTTTIRFQNNLQLKNIQDNLLNNSKQWNFHWKVSSTSIKNLLWTNNNSKINFPTDKEIENEFKKTIPWFNLDTAKKVYRRTEVVEYSLLVPNIEQVKNKMQLLDIKSISKAEILQNFENLKSIQKNFPQKPTSDNFDWTDVKVWWVLIKSNYCSLIYGSWTSKEKTSCIDSQNDLLNPKVLYNTWTLLNGFSIWTENRKWIHDSLSIDLGFWEKKIFEYGIYLHYNYWIWLRIPLKYKEILSKWDIYDYNNYKDYTWSIEITPFNANKSFYVDKIWAKKTFDGKEFYLWFWANVEWSFRVIKVWTTRWTIPLIKILWYAIRNLNNEAKDSSTLMWKLTDTMVNDNYLWFKKDFVPPLWIWNCDNSSSPTLNSLFWNFWNDNVITNSHCTNIVNAKWIKIPLAEIPLWPTPITFTTKLNLWLDVNLHNSKITAKCEDINSEWFCNNEIINFNPNNNKVKYSSLWIWKVINTDYAWKNDFWSYIGYGPMFSNIKYNTDIQYVFQVWLWWYLEHIPVLWSIWVDTPYYDLYSLDVNTDLETHTWTNWIIDITNKSKLYLEYETKIKEINLVEIWWDKYYLHYNNIWNWSSIFDWEDWKSLVVDGSKTWFYLPKQRQNMWHIIDNKYTTNWFNLLNDIKTYYTLDWTEPLCKWLNGYEYKRVDNLWHLNKKQNILWKTYYRDYKNHKWVTLKVISCDNVSNQKTKVFTKNNITLINTYHIPFVIYNWKKINNIPELQIWLNKTNLFRFKLAINNLQLWVWINSTINWNVIDYIKYAYLDKDVNPNNLKCNNNIWKIYSWEELTNADAFIDSNWILSSWWEKKLVIVKCSNDNYDFTSIPKVYALKAKRINNFKNPIDWNKFKNLQFDKNVKWNLWLLWEKNLWNNWNIFNWNLLNWWKLNWWVVPNWAQTFGYNPENQNPWWNATKWVQQWMWVKKNVWVYWKKYDIWKADWKWTQQYQTYNNTSTGPTSNTWLNKTNKIIVKDVVYSKIDKLERKKQWWKYIYWLYDSNIFFDKAGRATYLKDYLNCSNNTRLKCNVYTYLVTKNTANNEIINNRIISIEKKEYFNLDSFRKITLISVWEKFAYYYNKSDKSLYKINKLTHQDKLLISNFEKDISKKNNSFRPFLQILNDNIFAYIDSNKNLILETIKNWNHWKTIIWDYRNQEILSFWFLKRNNFNEYDFYVTSSNNTWRDNWLDLYVLNTLKNKLNLNKRIIWEWWFWEIYDAKNKVLISVGYNYKQLRITNLDFKNNKFLNTYSVNFYADGFRYTRIIKKEPFSNRIDMLSFTQDYTSTEVWYLSYKIDKIKEKNIENKNQYPINSKEEKQLYIKVDEWEDEDWSWNSQWVDWNWDANNQNNSLTSIDEYVNDKLDEINWCFISTYNGHLININNTIKQFNVTKEKINDQKTRDKYVIAIKKLEEIKNIFIKRYKFILDYKKKVSNNLWESKN